MKKEKNIAKSTEKKPVKKQETKTEVKEKKGFKAFMTAKDVKMLILRIVILLVIPYAYLMLCGLIFDYWLHMYNMTNFIFFSLIALYVIAVVLCVLSVVWYVQSKKAKK